MGYIAKDLTEEQAARANQEEHDSDYSEQKATKPERSGLASSKPSLPPIEFSIENGYRHAKETRNHEQRSLCWRQLSNWIRNECHGLEVSIIYRIAIFSN
jgi:hypothetical protein